MQFSGTHLSGMHIVFPQNVLWVYNCMAMEHDALFPPNHHLYTFQVYPHFIVKSVLLPSYREVYLYEAQMFYPQAIYNSSLYASVMVHVCSVS